MTYGHAATILDALGHKSPVPELERAVKRLKAWAAVNPQIMDLYLDFEACLRDVENYVADNSDGRVS